MSESASFVTFLASSSVKQSPKKFPGPCTLIIVNFKWSQISLRYPWYTWTRTVVESMFFWNFSPAIWVNQEIFRKFLNKHFVFFKIAITSVWKRIQWQPIRKFIWYCSSVQKLFILKTIFSSLDNVLQTILQWYTVYSSHCHPCLSNSINLWKSVYVLVIYMYGWCSSHFFNILITVLCHL